MEILRAWADAGVDPIVPARTKRAQIARIAIICFIVHSSAKYRDVIKFISSDTPAFHAGAAFPLPLQKTLDQNL
jgi:hypothetical protein